MEVRNVASVINLLCDQFDFPFQLSSDLSVKAGEPLVLEETN